MAPVSNPETEAAFQRVEAAVSGDTTVDGSAIALMENLAQMLRDALANAVDHTELQARINAIADGLENNQGRLAQAVVDNTPAAPTP